MMDERTRHWDAPPPKPVTYRFECAPGWRRNLADRAVYARESAGELASFWLQIYEKSGASVLSLDVFDNLLLRNDKPEAMRYVEVSAIAAERLSEARPERPLAADDVLAARLEGIRLAYRSGKESGGVREGRIDDIFATMAVCLRLTPAETGRLSSFELEYEAANLTPNHALLVLVEKVRARGGKVILLSDMYLDQEMIGRLTGEVCGGFAPDRIFSSADSGRSKRAATAFDYVEDELSLPSGAFFHIGDSLKCDYGNAIASGWSAAHFPVTDVELERRTALLESCIASLEARGIATAGWAKL